MEGKYTKAAKPASPGKISTAQAQPFPPLVRGLTGARGLLVVSVRCEACFYLEMKCFVLQKDIASISTKFGFNFHVDWCLDVFYIFLHMQRLQMLIYNKVHALYTSSIANSCVDLLSLRSKDTA